MSRSYKKSPVCTDGVCGSTKENKRIANHKVRQYYKDLINKYKTNLEDTSFLNNSDYKKIFCSYNIHDWIEYWSLAAAVNDYEHEMWSTWDNYETVDKFLNYWEKYFKRK